MSKSRYILVQTDPNDFQSSLQIIYLTNEISIEEAIHRYIDGSKPYKIVSDEDMPFKDIDFIDAWFIHNDKVEVSIEKARNIQREKLRQERTPLFDALDIQFMRAVEENNIPLQEEVKLKKQILRNVPQNSRINECKTCDELRNLTIQSFLIS